MPRLCSNCKMQVDYLLYESISKRVAKYIVRRTRGYSIDHFDGRFTNVKDTYDKHYKCPKCKTILFADPAHAKEFLKQGILEDDTS